MADNPKISQVKLLPDNQLYDITDSEARQDIQDVSDELDTHKADTVKHITAVERTFWNNKVTCYIDPQDDENLVFDFEGSGGNPITSITATFVQGDNIIYESDTLDDLKPYLTVVGTHQDTTTETITTYTLSGTLTAGTSVITAAYEGLTDTFNVSVTADPVIEYLYDWDLTESLTDKVQGASVTIEGDGAHFVSGTGIVTYNYQYAIKIVPDESIFELGKIYEFDIASTNYKCDTHGRLIMINDDDGFIYRNTSPRKWEVYSNYYDGWQPFNTTSYDADIFSGTTLKIIPLAYQLMEVYADDTLIYSGGQMIPFGSKTKLQIGSNDGSGSFYDAIITGIRIYNNPNPPSKIYLLNCDFTESVSNQIYMNNYSTFVSGTGIVCNAPRAMFKTEKGILNNGLIIEIDIPTMSKQYNNNNHGRFIMISEDSGLIYRYQTQQWEVYSGSWVSYTQTSSDPNIFNNKTVKVILNNSDDMKVYADDILVYDGKSMLLYGQKDAYLYLGSSGGQSAYNFTVSGLRIYYNNN